MIDINKEAEEYANNWEEITGLDPENTSPLECSKIDFVAGYNSKATQAKVIQGQIDVLKELDEINISNADNNFGNSFKRLRNKIKELQQQLKELENEH
jgi:hypothetical protein